MYIKVLVKRPFISVFSCVSLNIYFTILVCFVPLEAV